MSLACQNLKYLRKLRGWTQQEFADKLAIKRSLLGAYEEQRAEPRVEVLERVSDMFKISIDELLRKELTSQKENFLQLRRQLKESPRQSIEFVPVKAAAGYLAGFHDEEFIEELNTFTLPMLGAGHYRAFEIAGDSMLPVESGAVIVGHKIEGWDDIKNNHSYVVVTQQEGIVYKRIVKNNRYKNKVSLVSDNPLYQPYQVILSDVMEVWQADVVINKLSPGQSLSVSNLASMVNQLQEQVSVLKKKVN